MKYLHTMVRVNDLDASLRFYRDALGLELVRQFDNAGGRFAINSSTGQITVANGSLLDFETQASHSLTVR